MKTEKSFVEETREIRKVPEKEIIEKLKDKVRKRDQEIGNLKSKIDKLNEKIGEIEESSVTLVEKKKQEIL